MFPSVNGSDAWNPYFYCIRPDGAPATIELHGGTMRPYMMGAFQGANYIQTANNVAANRMIICPDWKNDMEGSAPWTTSIYLSPPEREMERFMSYGSNGSTPFHLDSEIGDPTSFVIICESYNYGGAFFAEYPSVYRPAFRHSGNRKGAFGFADGHAKMVDYKSIWDVSGSNANWTNWRLDVKP